MFYSQLILAKKGPLGTIWIAAHLERKLRKNQVTETNISVSVDSILFPEAPIALRLSGHLLLGVVRIYSRKVNYLFHDCSEALTKIKQAFHSGVVDLPPEAATAPFHAITLPENFDLDELEPLPDRENAMLNGAADHHVTTRELITLQDPLEDNIYFGSQFGLDERFPEADLPRMALDFEEFKILILSNIRMDRRKILMREIEILEHLLEIDEGGCDDPDFSKFEEMEKEAQEREQSPKLTLEEEVPPVMEEQIDFDRMDQMDPMDMEHLQPMTPAPPSMMDLDEEMMEPQQPEEQPEEYEQLAPVLEEAEQLPPVVEDVNRLEPVVEEEEQAEATTVTEAPEEPITETYQPVDTAIEHEMEEQEDIVAQEQDADLIKVPDELVPAIEGAAEELRPPSPAPLAVEQEDVPEVETLRSAVDPPTDQGPDMFAFEKEALMASESVGVRDGDQQMVDKEQLLGDDDKMEELPVANIPGLASPQRRHSLMEEDLPGDDDVLATLLGGRSTPALRVMPTPSEDAPPTRRFKRAPKPPSRKRKPILDIAMVIHGDVMREQLANTDDIRRVRKKAPCTQRELWAVQRQSLGPQVFSEPSIAGVGSSLRGLYDRMLVTGETDLPLADPEQEETPETVPYVTPEKLPATPQAGGLLEEPFTEEGRIPVAQPEVRPAADDPAAELLAEPIADVGAGLAPTMEAGAAVATEAGTPLQPEQRLEEAQDLNQDPKEEEIEDLNKEVVMPEPQGVEDYAAQSLMTPDRRISIDESAVQFPMLETEPASASEPLPPSSTTAAEPILLSETQSEVREEVSKDMQDIIPGEPDVVRVGGEIVPTEEDMPIVDLGEPATLEGEVPVEFQPELLEQVAAEAEAVAEAVAEGGAIVVQNKDGTAVIVLEDDGGVIDGPYPLVEVKEEAVEEDVNPAELGFLGEPRETVFLNDDDDDLHEEAEDYDDSTRDATLQGLGGWSARTRAVGGYLQGVFEGLNADTNRRDKDTAPKIGLDHTLRGKTRKEAARMFFETLVLKTKDYVEVDQEQPFGEIYLLARPKLMKANF